MNAVSEPSAPEEFDPFAELRREFRDVLEDLEELRLRLPRPLRPPRFWRRVGRQDDDRPLVIDDVGDAYEVHWDLPQIDHLSVEFSVDGQELRIAPAGQDPPARWPYRRTRSRRDPEPQTISFSSPVAGEGTTLHLEGRRVDLMVPKRAASEGRPLESDPHGPRVNRDSTGP